VKVLAAKSGDRAGQPLHSQPPTSVVDFVRSVVADVAGAEIVPPVPVVVETVLLIRQELGGAYPSVIVDSRRRIARRLVTDVSSRLHVPRLGHEHVADHAFSQHLNGAGNQLVRATLRAMLHDDVVPPGRIQQQAALAVVVTTRFLDVDVLSRIAGHDGCRRVPMVGRGNDDRVDRRVVQHVAKIAHGSFRAGAFLRFPPAGLVRVAHISHVGDLPKCLEQSGAAASTADDSHREPLVGTA
jgi:hypothetical protein